MWIWQMIEIGKGMLLGEWDSRSKRNNDASSVMKALTEREEEVEEERE